MPYDIEDAPKRQSLYTRYCIDIEERPSIFGNTTGAIFDFDSRCTLDIERISKFVFSIGYNIVLQYRDIRTLKSKTLMSYMISVQCRDLLVMNSDDL
jgi:hypothetical protein